MIDIPPFAPDLGSVLSMRNMLIVGISRPTCRFSYLTLILETCTQLYSLYFRLDELNYAYADMNFDLNEILKTRPTPGNDEGLFLLMVRLAYFAFDFILVCFFVCCILGLMDFTLYM